MFQYRKQRTQGGSSMATVLLLATVGTLFVSGMMGMLSPMYNKVMMGKQEKVLRSAAEASLDWAVDEINKKSGVLADDESVNDTSSKQTTVPETVTKGNGYTAVKSWVSVQNWRAPSNSYLYDPLLDDSNPASQLAAGQNGWRLVTATSEMAGRRRTIQVVLKPAYTMEDSKQLVEIDGDPVKVPYTSWAMFSRGEWEGVGNVTTDSFDSRKGAYGGSNVDKLGGDVGSNTYASIASNSKIGGNLNIYNDTYNGSSVVAKLTSNAKVGGEVNLNGNGSGFNNGNTGADLIDPAAKANPIEYGLDTPPITFPPAPSAPADATNLGALSLSGNKTMTLGPGNYVVSSIQIAGNAKLSISGSPVNIYVQGSSTSTPIHINGNGIANSGLPTSLRLFYNGNGNVHVNGNAGYKGLIYAPNAPVHINGNAQYYGSIVGGQMDVNGNVGFHYDKAFGDTSVAPYYWMPTKVTQEQIVKIKSLSERKVVSWREVAN